MITTYKTEDFPRETAILEKVMGEELKQALVECKGMIAGGALTSIFTGAQVNDLDIYLPSPEMVEKFLYLSFGVKIERDIDGNLISMKEESFDCAPFVVLHTNKSVTLSFYNQFPQPSTVYQIICFDIFPTAQSIFDKFDFTINMAAYDPGEELYYFDNRFLKDNAQRHLQFNENTSYPIISLLRVGKYEHRGYSISKKSLMKIALATTQLKIESWDQAKEQLSGMYDANIDEILETDEEYSLEKLTSLVEEADNHYISSISTSNEFTFKKDIEWTDTSPFLVTKNICEQLEFYQKIDKAYMVIPQVKFVPLGKETDIQLGTNIDNLITTHNGKNEKVMSEGFLSFATVCVTKEEADRLYSLTMWDSMEKVILLCSIGNTENVVLDKNGHFSNLYGTGLVVEDIIAENKV